MKIRMKKILSLALAFTMVLSVPNADMLVKAEEAGSVEVTAPTLPDGFSKPLEDNGGLTLASGANTSTDATYSTLLNVTTQWNNQNQCHATITDSSVFNSKAFTVLLDVKQNAPSGDTSVINQRTALTIGKSANSLHLLTYGGTFGYGSNSGGICNNEITLKGVEKDGWNAVAMTYKEDGGNGSVVIYVNGQKAGEVADIGFKLSTMSGLTAMLARSFDTNYLQEGLYDNLVIGNTVLDEATAIAETAYRKYVKDTTIMADLISIKAADVEKAVANKNGLTYKGFGMLNGNSTSNLLLDYKTSAPKEYEAMMEYLFGGENPLFTHIKMEMGNDGNNSTGAEACTMRYEDEEADASRSPGFVMVADAKKVNPNVKVSILRWEFPSWVKAKWNNNTNNQGYEAVYKWYSETIFDAYEKYGYVVDFVNPDKNETSNPDEAFIKWFAKRVETETNFPEYFTEEAKAAYNNIRIIASDENKTLNIVPSMRSDKDLYNAVDIIGFHYRTNATDDYVKMADVDDKEVWYSEGCATFGYTELQENKTIEYGKNSIGGYQSPLALMDSFITAFASSRRTHYMFQPAIGAFYEGIQYGHKELLSARDPWSGYIHYDPALYMLEHFAKFAKTGWEDSDPTGDDIWRAISASTSSSYSGTDNEHATAGIDGKAGYMTLVAPDMKDFSVVFVNNTRNEKNFYVNEDGLDVADDAKLNFWLTETDNYMQNKGTIKKSAGGWLVTLPPYSIATATTVTVNEDELRAPVDDIHNEDRAVLDTDETGATNGVTDDTTLYADNFDYEEYKDLKVAYNGKDYDYITSRGNEPRYMLDTHSAWVVEDGKLKQELASSVDQWNGGEPSTVVGDFRWMDYVASVDVTIPEATGTARLTIRSQTGMNWDNSGYTFSINGNGSWELYRIGTVVASGKVAVTEDNTYSLKLLGYGNTIMALVNDENVTNYTDSVPMLSGRVKLSSTWNTMYFDNLKVETVQGGTPYATTMVDGQDDCVEYTGKWDINNPGSGSADNWYRTVSSTSTANATFTFPIDGTGFAIVGANNGSAVVDVYVDDVLVDEGAKTLASPIRGETYVLSGLENAEHTIKVVVKSGTLVIDALHTIGTSVAVADDAGEILMSVDTSSLPKISTILAGTTIEEINEQYELPTQIEVTTLAGETLTKDIVWSISEGAYDVSEFDSTAITGTVQDGQNLFGSALTVALTVDTVVPARTYYFIDSAEANPSALATTEAYEEVKAVVGDALLNKVYDQLKTANNTWGLVDTDAGTKGYEGTADKMATGLYAKNNTVGETLSYAFTLPAGSYKVLSGHHDWWSHTRPMKVTVSYGNTTVDGGTVTATGTPVVHATEFVLEEEALVTYTLTTTVNDAPVISWLAVTHAHDFVCKDNGDGTHTAACKDTECGYSTVLDHEYGFKDNEDGTHSEVCAGCGHTKDAVEHDFTYRSNGKSGHKGTCSDCGATVTEEHTLAYTDKENGKHTAVCEICTYTKIEDHTYTYKANADGTHTIACEGCTATETEKHTLSYKDNANGTHTATCDICNAEIKEAHSYVNELCVCGAKEEKKEVVEVKNEITSVENASKGLKVTWNAIPGAKEYTLYRQTGKKWAKVKTTTAASYADKKANKNGTKYQYKVEVTKADGTKVETPVVTAYRMTAVKLSSVKNAKGKKITVKYAKNKKANGYEVQYATKNNFSDAKSLDAKKKTSATIKKLTKNKKYFVRVRAYKKSGSVKYYSAWSKVKNVKVKK